eukprot:434492_1
MTSWHCGHCGLYNNEKQAHCQACFVKRPDGKIYYKNKYLNTITQPITQPQPPQPIHQPQPQPQPRYNTIVATQPIQNTKWKCYKCGVLRGPEAKCM